MTQVQRRVITALAAFAFLAAAGHLAAQSLEVLESSGFVEVKLASVGWRQAVVGRQVPAGSTLTAWLDAAAKLQYAGSTMTMTPLTHARIISIADGVVTVELLAGGISFESEGNAVFEIRVRGMTLRVEGGAADITVSEVLVKSGTAMLSGAQDAPVSIPAGTAVSLVERAKGPVFAGQAR